MILFQDWKIQISGMIARQYDNLSRRLEVIGDLPEGWEWAMLVRANGAEDIISLEHMEGGAGVTLTRDQVSVAGYYSLQLRGTRGEIVKHTNVIQTFVPGSLTGTGRWPTVPSEFLQVEQRILALNSHPPIPGEDGFWRIWNTDTDQYETSAFPLPEGGSGGGVTAAGIRDALGYTPANEAAVSRLSEEKVNKPTSGNGTAGQFLASDGNGGTEWSSAPSGYIPARGKDYWTDADKAEIKGYVDDAILGGAW